jgi:hypothetical protein
VFFTHTKQDLKASNKQQATSIVRSFLMDSDSDSDDSLLAAPTFKKKTRENNQSRKADQILNQALKDYDQNLQQQALIQKLKREDVDQDALLSKVQNIQDHAASNTARKRQRNLTLDGLASDEDDENDDGALDAERFQALMHAKDTEISSGLGVRRTLSSSSTRRNTSSSNSSSSNDLPNSSSQAVKYLKELVLLQDKNDKASAPILKWLDKNIEADTLVECLNGSNFINLCQKHKISKLPPPLVQWLYAVACSGKGCLSVGAYQTLSQLLTHSTANVHPFLSLQDLLKQLNEWFGLKDEPTTKEAATTTTTTTPTTDPILSVHAKGLEHFLILWELALRQGLVIYEAETLLAHSTDCILALFVASLDKVFHSPKGYVSYPILIF